MRDRRPNSQEDVAKVFRFSSDTLDRMISLLTRAADQCEGTPFSDLCDYMIINILEPMHRAANRREQLAREQAARGEAFRALGAGIATATKGDDDAST